MSRDDEILRVKDAGTYEIRLQGYLDQGLAEWFSGFEIHQCEGESILIGEIEDQSALHGLLRRVRDLGIPLISVKRIHISS